MVLIGHCHDHDDDGDVDVDDAEDIVEKSWWRSPERLGICLDLVLIGRCHDHDDDGDGDVDVDDAEYIVVKGIALA